MHARHSRYRETAPHNADGNAKHESFLAMHYLTFIGYRSLMARKMLTLHRYTLTATIHCNAQAHFGGALGVSIAARQIVRPGAIAQVLNGLQEIGILSLDRRQLD